MIICPFENTIWRSKKYGKSAIQKKKIQLLEVYEDTQEDNISSEYIQICSFVAFQKVTYYE